MGKTIWDPYGRYVGTLVGFTVDPSGKVKSVGLDRGAEGFKLISGDRFTIEDEGMVLSPEWEAEGIGPGRNLKRVGKRLASLGAEIQRQTGALDDFILDLTAQFEAGEIDETLYGPTKEYCKYMRARNLLEVEELSTTLKAMLEAPQSVPRVQLAKGVSKRRDSEYRSTPRLKNIEAVAFQEYQPRHSSAQERLIAELP